MITEGPGWRRSAAARSQESHHGLSQPFQSRTATQQPRIHPGGTQPAGHDLIVIGGQNGADSSGNVVSDDIGDQARHALSNIQACLREAHADLEHIVRWSILIKDGAPLYDGFVAFMVTMPSGVCVR